MMERYFRHTQGAINRGREKSADCTIYYKHKIFRFSLLTPSRPPVVADWSGGDGDLIRSSYTRRLYDLQEL